MPTAIFIREFYRDTPSSDKAEDLGLSETHKVLLVLADSGPGENREVSLGRDEVLGLSDFFSPSSDNASPTGDDSVSAPGAELEVAAVVELAEIAALDARAEH
jgi:hypothetical protein